MNTKFALGLAVTFVLAAEATAQPAPSSAEPNATIEADGTVHVPAFRLPPSDYISPEAKASLPRKAEDYAGGNIEALVKSGRVQSIRNGISPQVERELAALRTRYDVRTEETLIAGVKGIWVRPSARANGRKRILINLPGGAFLFANPAKGGLQESIVLAGLGKFEILSLDYAQAPEAQFPAASEDVTKVYRELLKTHRASDIGIFGNSAGGQLVAQALVWFQRENLPTPAAAGVFCGTLDARWGGDAWYWHKPIGGSQSPPFLFEKFYYGEHDLDDPLISPIRSDAMLAKFPPTLLLTSTRAGEMSAAVDAHRRLVRNQVNAELVVWDGLGHCFFTDRNLPETQEAYDVMVRFFGEHVGKRTRK